MRAFDQFSPFSSVRPNKSRCEVAGIGVLNRMKTALCGMNFRLKKTFRSVFLILFHVSPSSPQLQRICFFYSKHKKHHSSASDWWEYTNFCFKENARTFSKNLISHENINFKTEGRL